MIDKKTFIAGMFSTKPGISAAELSGAVRDRFGKGLGFVELKKLREAHANGTFDRTWGELFRDEAAWEASTAAARDKKARGERRKKMVIRGRRRIDRDKVTLSEIRGHLVVYRSADGFMNAQQFDSRKRAEEFVQGLVADGVTPEKIGWFRRNELELAAAA